MKPKRQEVTREELEKSRKRAYRLVSRKEAYCDLINSCDECDRAVCFWCWVIRRIDGIQTKRILRICK